MAFDYKKEYREFYLPPAHPTLVTVPRMRYLAVRGAGDPNETDGAYAAAVAALYGTAYTLKMSPRAGRRIEGFFDYVVPPLEGLWRQEGGADVDYARKEDFRWVAMIRLPDFVTEADAAWAAAEAERKKRCDCSRVEFFTYDEGLCVQCLHVGPYDTEPETVRAMDAFAAAQGCAVDLGGARAHHEIYLSDPRRTAPEKCRTVVRHPIRRLAAEE